MAIEDSVYPSVPLHSHYDHNSAGGYGYGYGAPVGLDDLMLSNQIANGNQQLGDKICQAGLDGIRETSTSARDTIDAIRDSIAATNGIGNINLQSTERNAGESRAAVERAAGNIRDHISAMANSAQRDHSTIVGELCDVRKEMSDGLGQTMLELTRQHSEIKLEMCKQHADLAAKMAECCCDLKGEHSATRQLLQSQTLDEARRREADLQNEVNLLKMVAATTAA